MTAWSCSYINLSKASPSCSINFSLLRPWALTYSYPNTLVTSKKKMQTLTYTPQHLTRYRIFGERIKPEKSCQSSYISKLMYGRVERKRRGSNVKKNLHKQNKNKERNNQLKKKIQKEKQIHTQPTKHHQLLLCRGRAEGRRSHWYSTPPSDFWVLLCSCWMSHLVAIHWHTPPSFISPC